MKDLPKTGTTWKHKSTKSMRVRIEGVGEPYYRNGRMWPSEVHYSFHPFDTTKSRTLSVTTFLEQYLPE